jgi:hypothetical protein
MLVFGKACQRTTPREAARGYPQITQIAQIQNNNDLDESHVDKNTLPSDPNDYLRNLCNLRISSWPLGGCSSLAQSQQIGLLNSTCRRLNVSTIPTLT